MINVASVVNSAAFSQSFTLTRKGAGQFVLGGYETTDSTVDMFGSIQPMRGKDLEQIPEGDRVNGAIKIYTTSQIYLTRNDTPGGLSDVINWQGDQWRVISSIPWNDFGYWKAVAVRMKGA